ncbi:MAG: ABC transporter substrate-binding protein [Anaerolineae bacterium]
MGRSNTIRIIGLLVVVALLAAACVAAPAPAPAEPAPDTGPDGIIRFTFAPDPVWDYLTDTGIREEMEMACDLRILAAPTWDEFGIYAGGHADIVSVGSFEVPPLVRESGQESVIFGKYNISRSVVAVPADSDAQTLADVKGGKVAVWDTVSDTMIWGILAEKLHGLDFRVGGGDFELVLADITNTAELAANGEVDAALVLPDFSVSPLMEGRIRVIYDGATAADKYGEVVGAPHEGPMINIFLARKAWYEAHPDEIACFLSIWERGIKEWLANKDTIIASYPQHFAVETEDEIKFMTDYLNAHDWFVTSVYLDEGWVNRESELFDLMRETGFMEEGEENPEFDIVSP